MPTLKTNRHIHTVHLIKKQTRRTMFFVLFTYSLYIVQGVVIACPIHLAYMHRYYRNIRHSHSFRFNVLMSIYFCTLSSSLVSRSLALAVKRNVLHLNQQESIPQTHRQNRHRPYYYQYPISLFFCTIPFRNDIRDPPNKYIKKSGDTTESFGYSYVGPLDMRWKCLVR